MAVVSYLRGEIRNGKSVIKLQTPFSGLIFFHPVNEFKDEKEAFWGKAKGILPGIADFIFFWQNSFGAIELKTQIGTLSSTQRTFKSNFEALGGKYAICRAVSEVRDAIISWGLECKNPQAIEPKLSHNELLAMQAEIYRND